MKSKQYSPQESESVKKHIEKYFGKIDRMLHGENSLVDICVINPAEEHNFYTLVTFGMGAFRMKIPRKYKKAACDRAEIMITLPPDWDISGKDEAFRWPLEELNGLAEMEEDSDWLGWGHVAGGGRIAQSTEFSGAILLEPYVKDISCRRCVLNKGENVAFFQVYPIYSEERQYMDENDVYALLNIWNNEVDHIVDIGRDTYCAKVPKEFVIPEAELLKVLDEGGETGCFISDRIMVDGCKVGYMYREEPDDDYESDSGWRFLAGDEPDEYLGESFGYYTLNTAANYDEEIIPLLNDEAGVTYYRDFGRGLIRKNTAEAEL